MTTLHNPHDKFFKETFSRPEVARSFLENYLPPDVVNVLRLDTLDLRKDSFVDPGLQSHFSDLLYRVAVKSGAEALVYLLLEHKSQSDPQTPFQLLRYLVRIWEQDIRHDDGLRPIIPLVVYHGQGEWRAATNFGDNFPGPEPLRPYWPAFHYELTDLSTYSDAEIQGAALMQIGLLMMKHIHDPDLGQQLLQLTPLFRRLANAETALEYLRTVLIYVAAASDRVAEPDLAKAAQAALQERGGEIMPTLVEQWIEQGKREGLEQGWEQGLEQSVLRVLEQRFDDVPAAMRQRITDLPMGALERALDEAVAAPDLESFAAWLTAVNREER
jgi:predicted transposase/invertase (TIGR01784 family)